MDVTARAWRLGGLLVGLGIAGLLLAGCDTKPQPAPAPPPSVPAAPAAATQPATPQTPADWTPPRLPEGARKPPAQPLGSPTGAFLDRAEGTELRLVSWNVEWNTIFPDKDPVDAEKFVRVMRALAPDVLAIQEIGVTSWMLKDDPHMRRWSGRDVAYLLDAILPLADGRHWQVHQAFDNVILSKYPLKDTAEDTVPAGERVQAIALVDLPDAQFTWDLYVLNNHYKCCDPEKFDAKRQQQSDAIVAWIRDVRTPGGKIDLPARTPIVVCGDLNIVGSFQPVQTLIDGDIQDEQKYGADFAPDWDNSPLTDLHPRHNVTGPDDYTWRSDRQRKDKGFKPSRMDFIIYTDSTLAALKSFALNTTTMSDADLAATGLQKFDGTSDDAGEEFDHLPLVVDFAFVPAK